MSLERLARWSPAVALSAGLSWTAPAWAFCRTTTVGVPADYQPSDQGCWTNGHPLYWKNACVGYSLQRIASKQISYDDASNSIAEAFTRWTSTPCPTDGTGFSRVSIDVRDLGPVDCGLVEYDSSGPNQHVIVFRDDQWPHNDSANTLALTTVTFNPDSGEIYDADMEINSADQKLTVVANASQPIQPSQYDFLSIVTHETGHFLGMAHSADTRATMFAHYSPGSTAMRLLTSDDVAGICQIYPPDGTRIADPALAPPDGKVPEDACDPTPRHGFTTQCSSNTGSKSGGGCAVVTGSPSRGGAPLLVGAATTFAAIRRRRRRARRLTVAH